MEQVEEICDHIVLMNKGQKILDGTVGGVKQQYKENLFRIGLERRLSPADAAGLNGEQAFSAVGHKDGQLVVKIAEGHRPNDVLSYFIQKGEGVISFTEILPSLSDIFIRLVEGTPLARQFQNL
jgi:ABC-2 type transport system ATP-binding protein